MPCPTASVTSNALVPEGFWITSLSPVGKLAASPLAKAAIDKTRSLSVGVTGAGVLVVKPAGLSKETVTSNGVAVAPAIARTTPDAFSLRSEPHVVGASEAPAILV